MSGTPSKEELKKEESSALENNISQTQENIVEIPSVSNETNYIGLSLLGVSSIFFIITIIFFIIFVKYQAIFCENIFLLFNKEKIANVFQYIFRISFFTYLFGFLTYAFYYSIINKSYDLIIIIVIFLIFGIYFLKKIFFSPNKETEKETYKNLK